LLKSLFECFQRLFEVGFSTIIYNIFCKTSLDWTLCNWSMINILLKQIALSSLIYNWPHLWILKIIEISIIKCNHLWTLNLNIYYSNYLMVVICKNCSPTIIKLNGDNWCIKINKHFLHSMLDSIFLMFQYLSPANAILYIILKIWSSQYAKKIKSISFQRQKMYFCVCWQLPTEYLHYISID